MKLHILSDLHLEFEPFIPPDIDADVRILAGDISVGMHGVSWIEDSFPEQPVIYVIGNHEYYGKVLQKQLEQFRDATVGTNIHVLENDVLCLGDIVFLGCTLWTDFKLFGDAEEAGRVALKRLTDYDRIRVTPKYRKLHHRDTVAYNRRSIYWLEERFREFQGRRIVVVTHHAPASPSLADAYKDDLTSAAFVSRLDDFVAACGAELWVHGHVHSTYDYRLGATRVLCNPRGYPDETIPAFNAELVVEL